MRLSRITSLLNQHHQRATYGAVADVVGKAPRFLMQGLKKNWEHSWIVNGETGEPTGYPKPLVHPSLLERDEVLSTAEELREWLEEHG